MNRCVWLIAALVSSLILLIWLLPVPKGQAGLTMPTVPHNSVRAVSCDKSGNCWFATWGGIGVFSAADGRWTDFTPDNSGLAHKYCHDVAVDGAGRVWVAHHSGTGMSLLDYNGTLFDKSDDRWAHFPGSKLPSGFGWTETVSVDSAGHIWLGHSLGASRLDHKGTPFSQDDDDWRHISNADLKIGPGFVNAILEDKSGCLWFGSDSGLSRMCGGFAKRMTKYGSVLGCESCCWSSQWEYGWVWDLAQDHSGHIWAAFGNCGAAEWDGSHWTICDTRDPACGLPPPTDSLDVGTKAVAVDAFNDVWFGTRGRGVARLSGTDDWTLYTTEEEWLGSNEIEGIDFDQRNHGWFAAFGGAFEYAGESTASSSVNPAHGGAVYAPDRLAKASFGPGSVAITTTVTLDPKGSFALPGYYAAYAFDLSSAPPVSFNKPYTVTVLYTEASIMPLAESDLGLYWWADEAWLAEPASSVDLENNRVTASLDHMSLFALLGEAEHAYLPHLTK